jgi:hypothetical protein
MATDAHRQTLQFIYDQSYGKQVDTDRRGSTAPHWSPPGARRVRLPAGLDPASGGAATGPMWQRSPGAVVRWLEALRHLVLAGQVARREPSNPYNDHRPYPSSASQFSTHLWLSWGSPPYAWHYNPLEHAVEAPAVAPVPALTDRAGGYRIIVAADYREIDKGYHTLRYALAMLEAGHCLYNLAAVAAAAGLDHAVRLWFDDAALLAALGHADEEGWIPAAVVDVGSPPPAPAPPPPAPAGPAAAAGDVAIMDRLAWTAPAVGSGAPEHLTVPGPGPADLPTLSNLLYQRNAGRGMLGVTGRQGVLPGEALRAALDALVSAPGARPPVSGAALRHLAAVQHVQGYADGLYEIDPAGGTHLRRPGRVFGDIQAAYSYPASVMTIESFHIVLFMVVDYPRVVAELGPRSFRLTQLQLGWTAQAVGLALTAHDCFSRPVRAFLEWRLDALLELPPTETVAYQLFCSRNHLRDIVFDLRI